MRVRVVLAAAAVALSLVAAAGAERISEATRVTLFGDSAATAMAYNPDAKGVLARGIDLRLESPPVDESAI